MAHLRQTNGTRITYLIHLRHGTAEPVDEGVSWGFLLLGPVWFLRRRMWPAALLSVLGLALASQVGAIACALVYLGLALAANPLHHIFLMRTGYTYPDPGVDLCGYPREQPTATVRAVYVLLLVATFAYTYTKVQHAMAAATLTLTQMGLE